MMLSFYVLLCILYFTQAQSGDGEAISSFNICDLKQLNPGTVGAEGYITSPNYPNTAEFHDILTTGTCRVSIRACAECKLEMTININMPKCDDHFVGVCQGGCNGLTIYDTQYKELSVRYYSGYNEQAKFISQSRSVDIVFCRSVAVDMMKFKIHFVLTEKMQFVSSETNPSTGSISSPLFPHIARHHNGDIYKYQLENPGGFIRLGFTDWNIPTASVMFIYFANHTATKHYIKKSGGEDRPFVNAYEQLLIVYYMATDYYNLPYIGFMAQYWFVQPPHWGEMPNHVCGNYYHALPGGQFTFDMRQCYFGDIIDCVWVIGSPNKYRDLERVYLKIHKVNISASWDHFEVRYGMTSNSVLVATRNNQEMVSSKGFYVHLRTRCKIKKLHLSAVFTYFLPRQGKDRCKDFAYSLHCTKEDRCISSSLNCDGYDHCGDKSDELHCPTPSSCQLFACGVPSHYVCIEKKCDGVKDCPDGHDERYCRPTTTSAPPSESFFDGYHWKTMVPILLVCFMVIVIAMVVLCSYQKHRRRQHRLRRELNESRRLPTVSYHAEPTMMTNGDVPPSYEDCLRFPPNEGAVNLGYYQTEPLQLTCKPPPYSEILWQNAVHPPSYSGVTDDETEPEGAGTRMRRSSENQLDAAVSSVSIATTSTDVTSGRSVDHQPLAGASKDIPSLRCNSEPIANNSRRLPAAAAAIEVAETEISLPGPSSRLSMSLCTIPRTENTSVRRDTSRSLLHLTNPLYQTNMERNYQSETASNRPAEQSLVWQPSNDLINRQSGDQVSQSRQQFDPLDQSEQARTGIDNESYTCNEPTDSHETSGYICIDGSTEVQHSVV